MWKKTKKPADSRSNKNFDPIESRKSVSNVKSVSQVKSVSNAKSTSNVNRSMAKNTQADEAGMNGNLNKGAPGSIYASQCVGGSNFPVQPNPNVIKLMVVGDDGVGKTCFVLKWADGGYNSTHIPTVGVDFKDRTFRVGGKEFVVEIWDTAGSERFDAVTMQFYQNMEGIIIIFDVTNQNSFRNIERWIAKVKDQTENPPPIVIVGNKSDLEEHRVVKRIKAQVYAKEKGFEYYEASVKFAANIDEPVHALCVQALARRKELSDLRKRLKKEGKRKGKGMQKDAERSVIPSMTLWGNDDDGKSRSWRRGLSASRQSRSISSARSRALIRRDTECLSMSKSRRAKSLGHGRTKRRCVIL